MSTTSNTYIDPNTQNPQNVKPATQEPTYTEQATGLLSSATAAVSSYLPTSVTNAVAGVTGNAPTDTTTAYRNQQPHVGGVGDLGTTEEQDAVRVPEERQNPDPLSGTTTTADIGASNPAYNEPTGVQNQYNNRVAGETFPSSNSGVGSGVTGQTGMTGMSTTSGTGISGVGGHPGQPGGVGDLGTTSTTDVAVLPEERATTGTLNEPSATTGSYGVSGHPGAAGGVGDLGTQSEQNVVVLPDERKTSNINTSTTSGTKSKYDAAEDADIGRDNEDSIVSPGGLGGHDGRHHDITKEGSTGGHTGANYDVDHGLGMPHTRSSMGPSSTNPNDTYPTQSATGQSHTSSTANESREEYGDKDVPSPKEAGYPTGKPSVMDKAKAAVLMKTAKGDEEKIRQATMLKETGKKINPEEEARRAGGQDTEY